MIWRWRGKGTRYWGTKRRCSRWRERWWKYVLSFPCHLTTLDTRLIHILPDHRAHHLRNARIPRRARGRASPTQDPQGAALVRRDAAGDPKAQGGRLRGGALAKLSEDVREGSQGACGLRWWRYRGTEADQAVCVSLTGRKTRYARQMSACFKSTRQSRLEPSCWWMQRPEPAHFARIRNRSTCR